MIWITRADASAMHSVLNQVSCVLLQLLAATGCGLQGPELKSHDYPNDLIKLLSKAPL